MKIKKKSIIIPAFTLLIGASIAGSVTGTVAWYQYSTRVNGALVGVSGGTSENLFMRIGSDGEWSSRLTKEDIKAYLDLDTVDFNGELLPVTSGNMGKTDKLAKLYKNPIYGVQGKYEDVWLDADASSYIVLPLQLRYEERDGQKDTSGVDARNIAKDIYLSDLYIAGSASNEANEKMDLSSAIRFHISAYQDGATDAEKVNRLLSKNGGTTETHGSLDLDDDGSDDLLYGEGDRATKYGFTSNPNLNKIDYGFGSQVAFTGNSLQDLSNQAYYAADGEAKSDANVYSLIADNSTHPLDKTTYGENDDSKSIGKTVESETEYLNVVLTIWLEGWQPLQKSSTDTSKVASWDIAKYLGSSFDVGFEFTAE